MRTSRKIQLLGIGVAMAVTAGCGARAAEERGEQVADAPSSGASSSAAVEDESDHDGTGQSSGRPSKQALLVLVDVRVRQTPRSDRVVMQLRGRGRPGWFARYVDRAVADGSGRRIRLAGDSILDVYARGTTWPAPDYYDGPRRLRVEGDGPLAEVFVVGTFEGDTQVLAGIDGDPAGFRVSARTGPTRLVVDVLRPSRR